MESGYIAIIIVICTFICYVFEIFPFAITALSSVCAMVIFKVAPASIAWSAFGEDSVLLMMGMLVVGASLFQREQFLKLLNVLTDWQKGMHKFQFF